MKDKLKENIDKIPLPEGLDKSIELGFERARKEVDRRKRSWKKPLVGLAASLVLLVGTVGLVGIDKVEAAIKQALQYIPGYNIVVDKEEGAEVLVLKDELIDKKDDSFVIIKAALKINKDLDISIESNYGVDGSDETNKKLADILKIELKEEGGSMAKPDSWSLSSGGEFWKGDYHFKLDKDAQDFVLLVGDHKVDFSLEKPVEIDDLYQLGNASYSKGISISALKKVQEDSLKISLLNQTREKMVYEYPFKENLWGPGWSDFGDLDLSMYIVDQEGKKTYPTIPSSFGNLLSDFYFERPDEEGLKLVLPYVKIIYPNLGTEKVKLTRPKDGENLEINEKLELGDFSIELVDIKNKGGELVLRIKANSPEDERLEAARINGINGYGVWLNEATGYVEYFFEEKEVKKKFSINFESPTSLLLGDWEIDLD